MNDERPVPHDELLRYAATFLGGLATLLFAVQYIPQAHYNYSRKDVLGFSATGIVIKLIGASFLTVNSLATFEPWPVLGYGLANTIQHFFFMIQFGIYPAGEHAPRRLLFLWLFFLLLPYYLAKYLPASIPYTSYIKPITQIVSHLPQLSECWRLQTTRGVSLASQHLNFLGGLAGLYMCFLLKTSITTILLYINNISVSAMFVESMLSLRGSWRMSS